MLLLRVMMNLLLIAFLVWAGVYLCLQDAYFLRHKMQPERGHSFSGLSLYLLASSLFLLASFSAVTLRAALKNPQLLRTDRTYQGTIIVRYWYLLLPAMVVLIAAFMSANEQPNPKFATPLMSDSQ